MPEPQSHTSQRAPPHVRGVAVPRFVPGGQDRPPARAAPALPAESQPLEPTCEFHRVLACLLRGAGLSVGLRPPGPREPGRWQRTRTSIRVVAGGASPASTPGIWSPESGCGGDGGTCGGLPGTQAPPSRVTAHVPCPRLPAGMTVQQKRAKPFLFLVLSIKASATSLHRHVWVRARFAFELGLLSVLEERFHLGYLFVLSQPVCFFQVYVFKAEITAVFNPLSSL